MKVYTRTGDAGQTSLFNGARVPKNHALVDAYGTVDECNSAIGLAISYLAQAAAQIETEFTTPTGVSTRATTADAQTLVNRLQRVQQYMFDLGAHLATPRVASSEHKLNRTCFSPGAAAELEGWIDDMDPRLAPLTTFVLPGGHPSAAALHLARTVARRAERAVTPLLLSGAGGEGEGRVDAEEGPQIDEAAYTFLNRLSDFLFVASRWANCIMGCQDVTWQKFATRGPVDKGDIARNGGGSGRDGEYAHAQ